ncbi:MAG TPA: DUF4097 family beta strand repeat-containing protein [Sphaerochaeta sp.]|nr:DUF4097 family beta strand repeat-containing protein [Sphaerochaeta sp.]
MLKDSKANKIFLIIVISILAILFSMDFVWQKRGKENRSEQSYSFSPADSVKIITVSTDVILALDPKLKEAVISIGENDKNYLNVVKKGKELSIEVSPLSRGFLNFFNSQVTPLVVTLPQATVSQLKIETTSGDILFMQDVEAQRIQLGSISGDVDMLNLTGSEELSIKTISGDISGYSATSKGVLAFGSTSGDFEVGTLEGKTLSLHTTSGDIEGRVHILPGGSLEGSSTSGDLELDLSMTEDLDIRSTKVSGSILFNNQRQESSPALASTGNKKTVVKLATVSGDLDIRF